MFQLELQCEKCDTILDVSLKPKQELRDLVCPNRQCKSPKMILIKAQCLTSSGITSAITDLETRINKLETFCACIDENGEWEFVETRH